MDVVDTIAGGTDPGGTDPGGPGRRRVPAPGRAAVAARAVAGRLRGRRWPAGLAAVLVAAAVVGVSRAALPDPAPVAAPAPTPAAPGSAGVLLDVATGQDVVYVLADACGSVPERCGTVLAASTDDGRSWQRRGLPPGVRRSAGQNATLFWTLRVTGPDYSLSIEDTRLGRLHTSADGGRTWVERRIVDAPPIARVPTGRESYVRLCRRCERAVLEFLDPRSGVRSALATQPPFPPTAFAEAAGQLWAAGIDPATDRYATAVSTDDGATWRTAPLPRLRYEERMRPLVVPVPELELAYVLVGFPLEADGRTVHELWSVPDPVNGGTGPLRVSPEGSTAGTAPQVYGVVGLSDGRLLLDASILVDPSGGVDRAPSPGRDFSVTDVRRGPGTLLTGRVLTRRGDLAIAVADPVAPFDWTLRPVTLPT